MNMREFAGSSFITVETLRDGPQEDVIESVAPGKYDKPVATFAVSLARYAIEGN